jgi:hypothetical protein
MEFSFEQYPYDDTSKSHLIPYIYPIHIYNHKKINFESKTLGLKFCKERLFGIRFFVNLVF